MKLRKLRSIVVGGFKMVLDRENQGTHVRHDVYVCVYVHVYVYVYVSVYVCTYVNVYVCMYVYICICMHIYI